MLNRDIKTQGYVLRRTNYGESDRILNLVTPRGKITVIAKGARKSKSKLAGGIEMFTLADYNIHLGRGDFSILTGVKMIKHYGRIIKDLSRLELAAKILKRISVVAENLESPECFKIVDESLKSLDDGISLELVETWFLIRMTKLMGEEINLYRDTSGIKLDSEKKYSWHELEEAFYENEIGEYGENEIKMLRLILTNDLSVVRRVKVSDEMMNKILKIARAAAKTQSR